VAIASKTLGSTSWLLPARKRNSSQTDKQGLLALESVPTATGTPLL
jgi:hypothetical protein